VPDELEILKLRLNLVIRIGAKRKLHITRDESVAKHHFAGVAEHRAAVMMGAKRAQ